MIPHDWPFVPTKEQLEGLNKLRDIHNLPRLESVTRAREWFNACFEIDDCAESEDEQSDTCADCGKVAPDMGVCEFCDAFLCDECGVHAHKYVFCSQKCADEWMYTWIEDAGE